MSLNSLILKALLFAGLTLGACRADENDKRTRDEGFSLTVPQDRWEASRYCGLVKPEIPEDPTPAHRFETALLNSKLQGDGLTGWIHGAVPMYQQYIFTYRKEDPSDFMAFFKAEQFSLVPATPEVAQLLPTLKRHDKVVLKGSVFENGSPLVHLKVTSVEVTKKYDKPIENPYKFDLSQLEGRKTFDLFGQVHATAYTPELGHAVIVEHQDMMFPIAVLPQHAAVAETIFKGDVVNISIQVVEHPHGPPHFMTDAAKEQAIEIVDPIINCHGTERTVEGFLVKFEKSPAISTDVYAVRVVDANGIARNYTFFPGTNDQNKFMDIFMGVSAKAKAAWDADPTEPQVIRNHRGKETIRVKAKGMINVVSTEQANAQVYLQSADDVTLFTEQPKE